jgi:hypothetical protein
MSTLRRMMPRLGEVHLISAITAFLPFLFRIASIRLA